MVCCAEGECALPVARLVDCKQDGKEMQKRWSSMASIEGGAASIQ